MAANTTATEDATLTLCESFGGAAADCADIVERLDAELEKAFARIEELEDRTQE